MKVYVGFVLFVLLLMESALSLSAQTVFVESAGAYSLDISGKKVGGHAWCDFDQDGDLDLLVNSSTRSYLMQNVGSDFSDVTAVLAPQLNTSDAEHSAIWADLNNDGRPDFVRNSATQIEIYIQGSNGVFGDGLGNSTPLIFDAGDFPYGFAPQGVAALDMEGDGDLDLMFDNEQYGLGNLRNNGNAVFVGEYVYVGDMPLSGAGDYCAASDFNNDGFVDFLSRKAGAADLYKNKGNDTWSAAFDFDNAEHNNMGGACFADFDNDGDLDLLWTESMVTQIFEQQDEQWTALGQATGIPLDFGVKGANDDMSGMGNNAFPIDGLAIGDVDNDGDLDVFLSGDNRGYLYINQLNDPVLGKNSGTAMTFLEDPMAFFDNANGQGATFADFDGDGDLDLYVNLDNKKNVLYVNQLAAPSALDFATFDLFENRQSAGMTSETSRYALGATMELLDCDFNKLSGLYEVNGGEGYATQAPSRIHIGLPDGPDQQYIAHVMFPRLEGQRKELYLPVFPADSTNQHSRIYAGQALAPRAGQAFDDSLFVSALQPTAFNVFEANGSDPDHIPSDVYLMHYQAGASSAFSFQGGGDFIFTPDAATTGLALLTYYIGDSTGACPALGIHDYATVFLYINALPEARQDLVTIPQDFIIDLNQWPHPYGENLMSNDFDADGEELHVLAISAGVTAQGASYDIFADGSYRYSPVPGFIGTDRFNYSLCDALDCVTGEVVITVVALPDTDMDGIADDYDRDDDNDGLLDEIEDLGFNPRADISDCTEEAFQFENAVLESGADLQSGAVYRYNAVQPGVDALLTIQQIQNATLQQLDQTIAGVGHAFQPVIKFDAANMAGIEFKLQFVVAGTATPVNADMSLNVVAYDIDGSANFESIQFYQPRGIGVDATNDLNYLVSGADATITSSGHADLILDEDPLCRAYGFYEGVNSFRFRLQQIGSNFSFIPRYFRLDINDCSLYSLSDLKYISVNPKDSDGDGVSNVFDLDSDNDGIYDAVEAGSSAAHTLGVLNGGVNASGIPTVVDVNNDLFLDYIPADSNADHQYDFLSLDSDGDGCWDSQEAGFSDDDDDGILGLGIPQVDASGIVTNAIDGYAVPRNAYTNTQVGYCLAEICNNGIDDNDNDLTDCLDPDCNSDLACQFEVFANNDLLVLEEDPATDAIIDVLFNDSIHGGVLDSAGLQIITAPLFGSASVAADGSVLYMPESDYFGNDTLVYLLCDITATKCDTAYVYITVNPVNDPPLAIDDVASVNEDGNVIISVLDNDSDADGVLDLASLSLLSVPAFGSAILLGDGTISYSPDVAYVGNDTLVYSICDDGMPVLCATAQVVITAYSNLDPFYVNNDDLNVGEDDVDGESIAVLLNDQVRADKSTMTITQTALHGTLTMEANGMINYTPDANYYGMDSFDYRVCDVSNPGNCLTANVVVIVVPVNDAPIALDDMASTDEDNELTIDLIQNDSDFEGALNTASLQVLEAPAHGSVVLYPDGTAKYTPDANYFGTDEFSYVVCDNGYPTPFECDSARVYIEVLPVNDLPMVLNDDVVMWQGNSAEIAPLVNDKDIDGLLDFANMSVTNGPFHGQLTQHPDGSFTYVPDASFIGLDSFIYEICDDGNPAPVTCKQGVVNIVIKAALPVAEDDFYSINKNTVLEANPLLNDSDPNDNLNPNTFSVTVDPQNGTLTVLADGNIVYTPETDFVGSDTFDYQICDFDAHCAVSSVYIVVLPVNSAPTANNDAYVGDDQSPLVMDVCLNDLDMDGDSVYVSAISEVSNGLLYLGDDGFVYFVPEAGWCGSVDFTYTLCDGATPEACVDASVSLSIELRDSDDDFIPDYLEGLTVDTDHDGIPNYLDSDADNDGLTDHYEARSFSTELCDAMPVDSDGDGLADYIDFDSDNDGRLDKTEGIADCNLNGVENYLDPANCDEPPIVALPVEFVIPEGFSPNGDGISDTWVIEGLKELYPGASVHIMNRWGAEVYQSVPYQNNWDGIQNVRGSRKLETGTYYYLLELGDGQNPISGFVYLRAD